jgi:hypothetical protein
LNSCSIDKRADTVCSDPNFWIEYNRVNFNILPEEYPRQVVVDYDSIGMVLKMSNKRHSGKDVALMTYKLIKVYYHDLHQYLKVESVKNLYLDFMVQNAIRVDSRVNITRWRVGINPSVSSKMRIIPKGTVIDLEPLIEDIEMYKTDEYKDVYGFGEPFVEIKYKFPNIVLSDWVKGDRLSFDNPFDKSLWEYIKWLVKQPTKYYDVPNDRFIIVNYNASWYNIGFYDLEDVPFKPFLSEIIDKYSNMLLMKSVGKTGDIHGLNELNPEQQKLYDLLISDERLDTDPDIDALFTEYRIEVIDY